MLAVIYTCPTPTPISVYCILVLVCTPVQPSKGVEPGVSPGRPLMDIVGITDGVSKLTPPPISTRQPSDPNESALTSMGAIRFTGTREFKTSTGPVKND